jgi:hypothetical protein
MTDRDRDAPRSEDSRRRRLESVIPELLKRAVEAVEMSVEKASGAPDNLKTFVHEMKLPKEIATALLQQVDETKAGLFRVVAKEMRDFLEHTNLAEELQRMLSSMELEVKATVGFKSKNAAATPAAPAAPAEEESRDGRKSNRAAPRSGDA